MRFLHLISPFRHPRLVLGAVGIILLGSRPAWIYKTAQAGAAHELPLHQFAPPGPARAVMVLASGDGGWTSWEEKVAGHMAETGIAVSGWDTREFAKHPYNQEKLARGFAAAADKIRASTKGSAVPVIYAGWSTGAGQCLAAAASPWHHAALRGLLLISPGSRGRYGITRSDLNGLTPAGPDTWAVRDMALALPDIPIIQISAALDSADDRTWITDHRGAHRVITVPRAVHDYDGAGTPLMAALDESLHWLLNAACE